MLAITWLFNLPRFLPIEIFVHEKKVLRLVLFLVH
jgi:hypothetical protein